MVDVFVDTSAWYALRVGNDSNHEKARAILQSLAARGAWLHTSDWVLVETVALISNRVGRPEGVRTGEWILRNPAVHCHALGDSVEEAWALFDHLDGKVSLVDCGSFVVMKRLGLDQAFAFDQDFETQGFKTERSG